MLTAHQRGELIALSTSGTSGSPRAVVRTTQSWVDSFPAVGDLLRVDASSRVWIPGPLTSTMNLFAAVHASHLGAERVTSPARASHAHLTPAALTRLLADGAELDGVRVLVAGDRLDPGLCERASRAGARVSHYYGAAELSFVAWGSHADNLQPFPEVEVRAMDGILWVRSPYVCAGYRGKTSGPLRAAAGGWSSVGDRGRVEHGLVRVDGRGSEVVTTAGATVLLADVETALRSAARGDLVTVGVAHADLGQVLAAVLTDPTDLDHVRSLARSTLPSAHRPRHWFHTTRLPLTAADKVDRDAVARLVSPTGDARRLT